MRFLLNRSFVLILLIQYIVHYRVSKVIIKHTKLNHDHPNCFTNDTVGLFQSRSALARFCFQQRLWLIVPT